MDKVWKVRLQSLSLEDRVEASSPTLPVLSLGVLDTLQPNQWCKGYLELD